MARRAHCPLAAMPLGEVDAGDLVDRVLDATYEIERQLGSGAMGGVFRARHVRLPRHYAIKVLHPRLRAYPKLLERFRREAELAGRLAHPNVVSVVDMGEVDGLPYLVMELASGPSLADLIAAAPFEHDRAIDLLSQLCAGLEHAHARGLVHRDLKPDNVIVEQSGTTEVVRIVDFGLAILREDVDREQRLTTSGVVMGTPHYMAPEHATGKRLDHRSDLFAVGVIAYEMLTARMPFDGDGVAVVHANIGTPTPSMAARAPGVTVDPQLEAFTRRLLEKHPKDRPASAAHARALLDHIARGSGSPPRACSTPVPQWPRATPDPRSPAIRTRR